MGKDASAHREHPAASGEVHPLLAARPGRSAAAPAERAGGRRHNRPALVVFVVAGAITCLLLGYWQLSRWNSAQGSFQNLGYALEWPFFGAFLIFAYRRWVRLEDQKQAAEQAGLTGYEAGVAASPESGRNREGVQTEIPANFMPPRRDRRAGMHDAPADAGLDAYNEYLGQLNERKDA